MLRQLLDSAREQAEGARSRRLLDAGLKYGHDGHMKQAMVSELKNNLSRYLSYVKRGGVVRVFDRDRAVAEIVPIGHVVKSGTSELDGILADLERKGVVRRGTGSLPPDFLTRALPRPRRSVLEALLDERREGR